MLVSGARFSKNWYLYCLVMSSYSKFTSDKLPTIEPASWRVLAFKIVVLCCIFMVGSGALLKYCAVFLEQPVKSKVIKTHLETVLKFNAIFKWRESRLKSYFIIYAFCFRRLSGELRLLINQVKLKFGFFLIWLKSWSNWMTFSNVKSRN